MSLELHIQSGAQAGRRERFTKSLVAIGRHPLSDFRFDADRDLDVSSRHAEIRAVDGRYVLHDIGSRNGTFVNGERVTSPRALSTGDVIAFGATGPRVAVAIGAPAAAAQGAPSSAAAVQPPPASAATAHPPPPAPLPPRPAGNTTERIAIAVGTHTRRLRHTVSVLAGLLVVGVGAAFWIGHRDARARAEEVSRLSRLNDSLAQSYGARVAQLAGRVDGLDSALAASKQETDTLRARLTDVRRSGRSGAADSLARELHALESRRHAMLTATQVDYSGIATRNGGAVVLIAVQWPDGKAFSGSGFCISATGEIVTNRHLVSRDGGTPTRIAVIFSDTRDWLPAHVVRIASGADLALLQMDRDGPFPTVQGIVPHAAATPVGKSVAIMGYPLGVDTPMEGSGMRITARNTLVAGTVSKNLAEVLQIDAYAGEGSSGSPVFNTAGNVVGVVYGGARESGGRIVYAVPADSVNALVGR